MNEYGDEYGEWMEKEFGGVPETDDDGEPVEPANEYKVVGHW